MNRVIKNKDLKDLKSYEDALWKVSPLSNGLHPTTDAMVKWCSIIKTILDNKLEATSILDAGCGPSNLSLAIAEATQKTTQIFCIDVEPISHKLLQTPMCQCFRGNFFDMIKNIKDNALDLIVDGCSITHFDTNSNHQPNDGCYKTAQEAMRVLKPGGFLVTASDFSLSGTETGEFVNVDALVKSYSAGGLVLKGEKDFSIEDAFIANSSLNLGVVNLVFQKEKE